MKHIAKRLVLQWIFGTIYFLGLTFLLPFLLTRNIPTEIGALHSGPTILFTVAIFLVLIGFIGMFYAKHDIPNTLSTLGRVTLMPGLIGVVVSLTGKDFVVQIIERWLNIDPIRSIIMSTLDRASSQVWILTVSYIVVGVALFIWSKKMR